MKIFIKIDGQNIKSIFHLWYKAISKVTFILKYFDFDLDSIVEIFIIVINYAEILNMYLLLYNF